MPLYKNAMENIVESVYNKISSQFDYCQCERCRNDVIAYALNKLPQKYVVTTEGDLYAKARTLSMQYSADVTAALSEAFAVVGNNPRH